MERRGGSTGNGVAPSRGGASRRSVLKGFGAAGGGAVLAGMGAADAPASPPAPRQDERFAFFGPHQPGIVTAQQPCALIVALDVLANDRRGLETLFATLTKRIAFLMDGGPVMRGDPRFPPPDSGLLGPVIAPSGLTVTVGVGASLFDTRFGLASVRPAQLTAMERFPNDALDAAQCHGDLVLQLCAHRSEATMHALRDIIRHVPDLAAPRWMVEGVLPRSTEGDTKRTPRNMLGFKDGTANLDRSDPALMERLVGRVPLRGVARRSRHLGCAPSTALVRPG